MVFFTGKNGHTRPVDFVPDPTRKTSTHARPVPAGTGRVRVYPRVRVDPHTSSSGYGRWHGRWVGGTFSDSPLKVLLTTYQHPCISRQFLPISEF